MINFMYFSGNVDPSYFGNILSGRSGLFILIGLVFLVIVGCFLIVMHFKKRFDFTKWVLKMRNEEIDSLKKENQKLKQERAKLEDKQKEIENERNEWKEERNKLFQEIATLEAHIKNFEKAESDQNSDIIIEYYMNEDSGE